MTQRLSSPEVDDRAAVWAAKVDAGTLDPQEQAALNAWLEADARHFGSYAKALAVLAHTDKARALGATLDLSSFRIGEVERPSRRRFAFAGAIAATLVAGIGIGIDARRLFQERSYETRRGETLVVPLDDGSVMTLNTDSKAVVRYTQERRDIQLMRGEALFDVAKNKKRPFIVEAAGTQVRAVGTSFTVSLLANRPVEVLVREGVVEIDRPAVPMAPPVRLSANNRAVAPADAPIRMAAIEKSEVTRALSWRVGRLAFEGETLENAAAEFARYSDVRIEIDDPAIARMTVTGLFVSNDPIGFSKALAVSLDLQATVKDNVVRLSR
jgi:transmembrane sensor